MMKFVKILAVVAGCMAAGTILAAQNPDQQSNQNQASANRAANLQQLLQQVQQAQNAAAAVNAQREREFAQALDKQQEILARAQAEKQNVQKRSDELQATFNANEQKLNQLSTQLRNRMGSFGEVFGVVRQTAADLKGIIDSSLISAQLQGRGQFLSRIAASTSLPSINELQKLWYMLLHQAAAEGQVVRFPTTITRADGTQTQADVVRVGGFDAIRGNDYLNYLPETGQLVVYAQQPSRQNARDLAAALYGAKSGNLPMAVDPTKGQLLSLLITTPSVWDRLQQAGAVGYIIIALFIIGLLIALERIIALTIVQAKVKKQLKTNTPNPNNALGRVLNVYAENPNDNVETLELKLDEAILKEQPALEAWQGVIKLIAAVGPLLGLLGTVIGMIVVFQTITLFGGGNPKLMAGGISYALVTTVEGLVTAIPLVILHAYITSKSRAVIQVLEEQSAGIVAAQAEKKK
ncbi:MAG TPA: MotA/TolQ/ExbB proton channel family protein [Gammaproteobacteria bacterium]|nr:MotA/TolQ/ExbB proton channel family protein [Gammaproteobacteria bacterium]